MVPLSLRLRNFLSYGLEGGDLDLRPLHIACLSGANGNGKSALVDAITWVLWGRSRAGREDDLLRHGTSEMEVEFEFACHHAVYRVIRKRALRKSGGVATLELAIRDGETYRAITGNTILDTEHAISTILRLSYETFINSSLLLQGRADLFTVKRPAERKEILGEILGLNQYEALAERARERERDYRAAAENGRARIEELDRFLEGVPTLQEALTAAEVEAGEAQRNREAIESEAGALERRTQALVGVRESLARLIERLQAIQREEAAARARFDAATANAERAAALLAGEQTLREQVEHLRIARMENDRLTGLVVEIRALEKQAAVSSSTIAAEEARLQAELRAARHECELAAAAELSLHAVDAELRVARERQGGVEAARIERERIAARLGEITEQVGNIRGAIGGLETRMVELRDRIRRLRAAGAICPTCGIALDEARRTEAHDAAKLEGVDCKGQVALAKQRETALLEEQERARATLAGVDRTIGEAQNAARREAELEEKSRALRTQVESLDAKREALHRQEERLRAGDYAEEARAAARSLQERIAGLGYNSQVHGAIAARIRELSQAEIALASLDQARADLHASAVELSAASTKLAGLGEERERVAREQEPLQATAAELPAVAQALEERRGVLHQQRAREAALHQRIGSLRGQLEEAGHRQAERTGAVQALEEAERQAWAHRELALIFGKRGIQAMLIENALPELEQDANELLARMTDNSTQVKFATQRTGTGGRAIETLDIKIADSMGTRSYEMFSGGEAFRINFAIRIALSKLLARGAGADLSFLLIDEGFGTQDAQGRDRLVEAITAIADDFEKVLVVTHIDELKDQFDVHVEVSKGLGGSHITVTAA